MEKNIIIGNVSTIIKIISLSASGFIFGILSAFGLKLPFNQYELAGIIGLIIGLVFSYIDAKYPNTLLNKPDEDILEVNVAGLSDAQIGAINNFIKNATSLNEDYGEDPMQAYENDGA